MSDIEIAKKAQIQFLTKTIQELASLKSSETKTLFIESKESDPRGAGFELTPGRG